MYVEKYIWFLACHVLAFALFQLQVITIVFQAYSLFCFESFQTIVSEISKITHSHQDAIIGAQLECAAVHTALHQKVRCFEFGNMKGPFTLRVSFNAAVLLVISLGLNCLDFLVN